MFTLVPKVLIPRLPKLAIDIAVSQAFFCFFYLKYLHSYFTQHQVT